MFRKCMDKFCQQNGAHPRLGVKVRVLSGAAKRICEIARKMNARQKTDTLQWASYAYPALTGLSEIFMSWRLLDMAIIADRRLNRSGDAKDDFYQGKVLQATFFSDITLHRALADMETCLRNGREIIDMPQGAF